MLLHSNRNLRWRHFHRLWLLWLSLSLRNWQIRQIQCFFFCRRCRCTCLRARLRLERQQTQQRHSERSVLIRRQTEFLAPVQANAVEQLCLISRHNLRQISHSCGIRVGQIHCCRHIRHHLHYRHTLEYRRHFFQRGSGRHPVVAQCIHGFDHGASIALGQSRNQTKHIAAVHTPQHLAHSVFLQLPTAKSDGLIGQ